MEEENLHQEEDTLLEELLEDERVPNSKRKFPIGAQLGVVFSVLLLIFGAGFAPKLLTSRQALPPTTTTQSETPAKKTPDPFVKLEIEAKAAIVLDVASGEVIFEKEADKQLPLASVTKLMTALVARELLNQNGNIKIDKNDLLQSGDSGLSDGEIFNTKKLNDLTLIMSSNDGAFAMAAAAGAFLDSKEPAAAFVKAMNIKAKELNLTKTYYRNPTGLDLTKTEAGAYGSARDMSTLMEYIIKNYPEILEETTADQIYIYNQAGVHHDAENTNPIVNSIPGLIGSKTGYTELAGGNLIIAYNTGPNHPIVISVLGSSHSGRFNDILKLIKATNTNLESIN